MSAMCREQAGTLSGFWSLLTAYHIPALSSMIKHQQQGIQRVLPVCVYCMTTESNKPLCGQYQIQGFPTIKAFGEPGKPPVDYQGAREAAAIKQYATNIIPSTSKRLSVKNAPDFIAGSKPKVVLFTDKNDTPVLYKSLSTEFKAHLAFGEVQKSNKELVKQFGITAFPTLLVLPAGTSVPKVCVNAQVFGGFGVSFCVFVVHKHHLECGRLVCVGVVPGDATVDAAQRFQGQFQGAAIRVFLNAFLPGARQICSLSLNRFRRWVTM
jgi:hypothetical protein